MSAKKILVTGSAGFIGFHTSLNLLRKGYEVVGLDNYNDYYAVGLKERRVEVLAAESSLFSELKIDLADPRVVDIIAQGGFDVVCNLAAQVGVRYSVSHPQAYMSSNIIGFLNVLEGCRRARRAPRLVYASSSSVYGGLCDLPFVENARVDKPISLYAASKKSNELMAYSYCHLFDIQCIGLRFFTVYGPWGRPDMAMWLFTEKIAKGEPIPVFNHGDMKRSFTYIDDIVDGVIASMFSNQLDRYEIFNLGNDKCDQLLYVIDTIGKNLGARVEKQMLPMQPGDVPATWADVSLARRKLDYNPQSTSIEKGIALWVEWYLSKPDIAELLRNWRRQPGS